jgi:hypothetical protein
MNPLYGLMLFGIAFFGFMVVVGVVQARRKKEKAYYIGSVVSLLMLLWFISIIANQLIFALAFFVAWITLTIVGLPKMMKTMKREPLKELQETDFSAPLRVRELLTWKGWFKLTSRWGIRKTMCLYSLLNIGSIGAIVFTLSILDLISMVLTAVVTILVGIFAPIFFYYQIGKALEQTEEKHR